MPNIKIRRFMKKDAVALQRMLMRLAEFHGEQAKSKPIDFSRYCYGSNKLSTAWVAVDETAGIIGFVLAHDWMNFLRSIKMRHIDYLYVYEDFRRYGVAMKMLKALAASALKQGCQRIDVSARIRNKGANKFYLDLGFVPRPKGDSKPYAFRGRLLKKLARSA
jgi:GNAT superfamily N-acetyltransferase